MLQQRWGKKENTTGFYVLEFMAAPSDTVSVGAFSKLSVILWVRAGTEAPLRGAPLWELGVASCMLVSVDPPWMRNYLHWDPFKLGEPAPSLSALRSLRQQPAVSVRTLASQLWRFRSPWPLYFSVNLWEP